jgi:hypothetical protein
MATRHKQDVFERLLVAAATPTFPTSSPGFRRGSIVEWQQPITRRSQLFGPSGERWPRNPRGIIEKLNRQFEDYPGELAALIAVSTKYMARTKTAAPAIHLLRGRSVQAAVPGDECARFVAPVHQLLLIGQLPIPMRCMDAEPPAHWWRPPRHPTTTVRKWEAEAKRLRDRMRRGSATDEPVTRDLLEARAVKLDYLLSWYPGR